MTPNKIPGMKYKGPHRAPIRKHEKKEARSYLKYAAHAKKTIREQKQFEKANREYLL